MGVTISASSAALAHANYVRSDPPPNAQLATPPTRVVVGFSEKVQLSSSSLTLLDDSGRAVASGAQPTSDPTELQLPVSNLTDGVYTVAWQTVSAEDGDAARGYFAFELGTPRTVVAPPLTQTKTSADGIAITLAVSPNAAGKNGYVVTLTRAGSALANVTRVRVRFTPLDRDLGQTDLVLVPGSAGPGSFAGSGFELPISARYSLQVQVRRPDLDDLALDFDLSVPRAVASPSPSAVATSAPPAATPARPSVQPEPTPVAPIAAGALVAIVAVLGVLAWRRRP